MAPYLLQWTAIQMAKNRNIRVYDFLGVADPSDPTDPLLGVTDFKSRFGGSLLTLPEKILIPLSWKYRLFRVIHTTKNLLK
jgi:lipid II:glycine glycyltransferase (peptidoglycan interpeptide bridge formation enzyme)